MLYAYDGMGGIYHTISPVLKNPPKSHYNDLRCADEANLSVPKERGKSRKTDMRVPPGSLPWDQLPMRKAIHALGNKYNNIHIWYVV